MLHSEVNQLRGLGLPFFEEIGPPSDNAARLRALMLF